MHIAILAQTPSIMTSDECLSAEVSSRSRMRVFHGVCEIGSTTAVRTFFQEALCSGKSKERKVLAAGRKFGSETLHF